MYITTLVILLSTIIKSTQCLEQAANMPRYLNEQTDVVDDNKINLSANLFTSREDEVVDPELQFDSAQVRSKKVFPNSSNI